MCPENQQQYLFTMRLFGLFLKCPFREATADCPFIDVRKLGNLELKFQLAEKMASHPRFREDICNTHEACYRERMRQVVKVCRGRSATPAGQRTNPLLSHHAAMGRP